MRGASRDREKAVGEKRKEGGRKGGRKRGKER